MQDVMAPEEYELLMSLGGDNAQLAQDMALQQAQAEALRQDMPQGGMAGRVYVGASPLQFLAKLGTDNVVRKKQEKAAEMGRTMGANTQQQNRMVMQGILKGNQPTPAPAMPEQGANPYEQFRRAGGLA